MKAMESLLLRGGLVLDPESGTANRKDLLIEDGQIAEVGAPGTLAATATTQQDAHDRLIVPGLVNAHTHGHAGKALQRRRELMPMPACARYLRRWSPIKVCFSRFQDWPTHYRKICVTPLAVSIWQAESGLLRPSKRSWRRERKCRIP